MMNILLSVLLTSAATLGFILGFCLLVGMVCDKRDEDKCKEEEIEDGE